jgi:hypothetical protein
VSAIRSFYLFQRVECLELEARRLAGLAGEGAAADASRKQIINSVGTLRRDGMFLALVVLLCTSKIVTE